MARPVITRDSVLGLLEAVVEFADEAECVEEAFAAKRIKEKVRKNEWYLVLLGETSSGKSSFANTILGDNLIPANTSPTTGAVVFVQSDPECQNGEYLTVQDDGTLGRSLTRDEFRELVAGDGEIKRLFVRSPITDVLPPGLIMVDTPGFNSVVNDHLDTLHQCLPESDAILFFINYRRGMSKTDRKYFTEVAAFIGDDSNERISVVVNFAPNADEDKRIAQIRTDLLAKAGFSGSLYILKSERIGGRLQLSNDQLFEDLQASAKDLVRQHALWRNALTLNLGILERIGEILDTRRRIILAEEEAIMKVKKRLLFLQETNNSMLQTVLRTNGEMLSQIKKLARSGEQRIEGALEKALDQHDRWRNIDSATIYISNTVVECGLRELGTELNGYIDQRIRTLSEELDGLAGKSQEAICKLWETDLPSTFTGIDQKLLGRLAGQVAGGGARWYLRRIAGAPGEAGVVGVMNLTRKLMGNVNKLFKPVIGDNLFGRGAMAKVGPLLRRSGVTTGRAAGFAAAAAVDIVVFLIKGARWKQKLRKGLKPLISEQCSYLEKEATIVTEEILTASREMVEANFVRRAQVISDALEAREASRALPPDQFERLVASWKENLAKVESSLNTLIKERKNVFK